MGGLYVSNLGCKVNRVESDSLLARAQRCEWIADSEKDADVIVVNTCTVTGEAQKKTRKAIRQALRSNDDARIVVAGCAAAIDPDELASIDPRIVIVSKQDLETYIEEMLPANEIEACDALRVGERFRTRVGIKVQDGCANACTYCIVHTARGKVWSKPSSSVIDEAIRYMGAGVRELVFAGINLGSYNDGGMGITDLVFEVLKATDAVDEKGIPAMRLRLSSIEPCDIDDAFIELLASSNGRVCRHLHIPVQSGSSKVLSEMARPYDADAYLDLIRRLYERVPKISISTDIIVGFPGETDQDFKETLELARACRFSKIHVFPYSRRKGTPAAIRPDQIDPEAKRIRSTSLRALSDELRKEDAESRIGDEELVVVERAGRGLTESYHEVRVSKKVPLGSMVRARIERGSCVVL
ncbi:MAG: MiaB/RimO family radical SAM methylthiotransferase [Eggerthellaceae bacterium]|nr:MiaB/RimO family radical SAM methylthiotransferase [Eggerthellaceae bacterium]